MLGWVVLVLLVDYSACQCGSELGWTSPNGVRTLDLGGLGIFRRDLGEYYTNLTSCLCESRCKSAPDCRRWSLLPRYLGTTGLISQKCDNKSRDKEECGWSAKCVLKETSADFYDGEHEPIVEDGYLPRIAGAVRCTRPSFPCRSSQCCGPTEICHETLGCIPPAGSIRYLSPAPWRRAEFLAPLVTGICLIVFAILLVLIAAFFWASTHRPMSPWLKDIIHILMEGAALVFILSEFVSSFIILTKVDPDDYVAVTMTRMGESSFNESTVMGDHHFDAMIRVEHVLGRSFPFVVDHVGENYYISGQITDIIWTTGFQFLMYVVCPLQLLFHLAMAFHKIWLGYKQGRGHDISLGIRFYIVFLDITGPLENGYIFDPVSRAWNDELFESIGMPLIFQGIMIGFFLSQALFVMVMVYLRIRGNFDFLTLQRKNVKQEGFCIDWTTLPLYIFPFWFSVMVLLSFIYKGITPNGPGRVRIWYFWAMAVVCHLIKHLLNAVCRLMSFDESAEVEPERELESVVPHRAEDDDPYSLTTPDTRPRSSRSRGKRGKRQH